MGIRTALLGMIAALPTMAAAQSSSDTFPPIQDVVRGDRFLNIVKNERDVFGEKPYKHLLAEIPPARNRTDAWEIWSTEWTEEDEHGYEAFVTAIGRTGCISIDDCLRSPANPYREYDDEDMIWLGDCTDMVYVLRGYYAWKRGLPFSFQDAIAIKPGEAAGNDSRYSKYGNKVTSRADVIHPAGYAARSAPQLLTRIFNIVSTAMLRVHPEDEGVNFADFYPLEITRETVRPGSIAYDIYGHVSIIYDVEDDGRILMISSHPDYTVTREPYGHSVVRSEPALGAGIKAWRPIKLVNARQTSKGTYIGGNIIGTKNKDLADFSMEQYWGTHPDDSGRWDEGKFFVDDRFLPYYDWVRARLRLPGTSYDPVDEMTNAVDALCSSLRSRKSAVNMAIYAGVHEQPAPKKLPPNIYGTYGDWERYATPSRDARIKTQAMELDYLVRDLIARHEAKDPSINFPTGDLPAALLDVYDRKARACKINYKRSDGSTVKLNMYHAMDRLFDISFDPYHCPERRWGAKGSELATCPADEAKEDWYDAQRYLRNDPERTYELRTDFTARELKNPAKHSPKDGGVGRAEPPDIDFYPYLEDAAGDHTRSSFELPMAIITNSDAVNNDEDITPPRRRDRRWH